MEFQANSDYLLYFYLRDDLKIFSDDNKHMHNKAYWQCIQDSFVHNTPLPKFPSSIAVLEGKCDNSAKTIDEKIWLYNYLQTNSNKFISIEQYINSLSDI